MYKIVIYSKQSNTNIDCLLLERGLLVMDIVLVLVSFLIILVISLLYIVVRIVYKDYINESPLYIITDKRNMIINEVSNQTSSVFLVELNGEFFVNVTEDSYNKSKIGDQIMLANSTNEKDFIIKKL